MDTVLMRGMRFFGRHGVFPAERELGARFTVDVELDADLDSAAHSDQLGDTVDYARAYEMVREVVEGEPCHLLEAVAQRIADRLLTLPLVVRTTITVHKRPPLAGDFDEFAVRITREHAR